MRRLPFGKEAEAARGQSKLADEMAEGGMVGWSTSLVRKLDMIVSMSEVRGPFHSSQVGLGSLRGRL